MHTSTFRPTVARCTCMRFGVWTRFRSPEQAAAVLLAVLERAAELRAVGVEHRARDGHVVQDKADKAVAVLHLELGLLTPHSRDAGCGVGTIK
eukprot:4715397-Pleurochrysis_carterae.AAC.2